MVASQLPCTIRAQEHYPLYEVVTVDGVDEVIEFRKMEPFFYIVEDESLSAKVIEESRNRSE